jgi:hypothetical protein
MEYFVTLCTNETPLSLRVVEQLDVALTLRNCIWEEADWR